MKEEPQHQGSSPSPSKRPRKPVLGDSAQHPRLFKVCGDDPKSSLVTCFQIQGMYPLLLFLWHFKGKSYSYPSKSLHTALLLTALPPGAPSCAFARCQVVMGEPFQVCEAVVARPRHECYLFFFTDQRC